MPYIGNDPVKNASVGTDQLKDDAVTNSKIIDDITFNTGSFSRVESTNYSGEGGALTGVATPASVTSSFAQKSAVSSSFVQGAAVSGSFVTSSAFTGNMGDISGSSTSTGSFGIVEVAGDLSVTGAGQGWVKVAEVDASNDATVTITFSTGDTYKTMMCVFRDIVHETDAQDAYVRLIVGGSTRYTDYSAYIHKRNPATNTYNHNEHTSGTFILYGEGFGTASGEKANGRFYWYHPAATDTQKHIHGHCLAAGSANNTLDFTFSGGYDGAETALTGFVFSAQNDNIMSGTYTIYGLSTS